MTQRSCTMIITSFFQYIWQYSGKNNEAIKDAPLSGGQNDNVNAVENGKKVVPAWTSPQALGLQTNGLEQMLGVLKAGKYLKLIFQSLGNTQFARWWNAHPEQKEVFQKMKDVFTEDAKYSFETSDLRRAQLEVESAMYIHSNFKIQKFKIYHVGGVENAHTFCCKCLYCFHVILIVPFTGHCSAKEF